MRARLSCDAFADHYRGEGDAVFELEAEETAAGVAVHVFIAVVFSLHVDHRCAVRALALTLIAVIPLVVLILGDLCQRGGLRSGILTVLARRADKAVSSTPRGIRQRGPVRIAAHPCVVLVADAVAVTLTAAGAFRTAGHPVPGSIDALGVQALFRSCQLDIRQTVAVWPAMPAVIPSTGMTAACALGPLARDLWDQNLGVFAHGNLQAGAALRGRMRHVVF